MWLGEFQAQEKYVDLLEHISPERHITWTIDKEGNYHFYPFQRNKRTDLEMPRSIYKRKACVQGTSLIVGDHHVKWTKVEMYFMSLTFMHKKVCDLSIRFSSSNASPHGSSFIELIKQEVESTLLLLTEVLTQVRNARNHSGIAVRFRSICSFSCRHSVVTRGDDDRGFFKVDLLPRDGWGH